MAQCQGRIKCYKDKYFNTQLDLKKEREIRGSRKEVRNSESYRFMRGDAMGTLRVLSLNTGPQSWAGFLMPTPPSPLTTHDRGPM